MKTKIMAMAAASLAMAATGPALAQQNGKQTRTEARQNSQGPSNAARRGIQQSNENSVLKGSGQTGDKEMRDKTMRDGMRSGSQGRANASDRALSRANPNSALANIQPGQMVHDRNGQMLGTIKEIRRSPTGVVVLVVVVLQVAINGVTTVSLSPSSLTIVNNILVTTQITAPTLG